MLQNQVFATIQPVSEKAAILQTTKPKGSLKQRIFTRLLQRKIRHLSATQPALFAQKDSTGRECVTITLKNGRTILGTIISMDEKNITYKFCDHSNEAEGTIRVEQVAHVTDAQNRMIFNNQPTSVRTGVLTKGDKNATASVSALLIAFGAVILAFFAALSSFFNSFSNSGSSSGETLVIALALVFIIGIIVSFVTGIMSLTQMAKTPPQRESSKFLAILSTIVSGLFLLLMLLNLGAGF
jgi:hypothetical protein